MVVFAYTMCAEKRLLFVVFIVSVVLCVGEMQRDPVSGKFLDCLCRAFSGCNTSIGCMQSVCGPYQITIEYWIDADKPTLLNDTGIEQAAYTRCVNDIVCSAKTVRQYMEKHAYDCNGDGVVNSADYFMTHYFGPYSCGTANIQQSSKYDDFNSCMVAESATELQKDTRKQLLFVS